MFSTGLFWLGGEVEGRELCGANFHGGTFHGGREFPGFSSNKKNEKIKMKKFFQLKVRSSIKT